MKITLLSTSDQAGGAAIACLRLAEALLQAGNEVRVLVMEKKGEGPFVVEIAPERKKLDALFKDLQYAWNKRFLFKAGASFSANPWWGHEVHAHPAVQNADVINLHWVNHGFLGMKGLEQLFALGKPMVWHMHDYWAFTGGCHYPGSCNRFEAACGCCPILRRSGSEDVSHQVFKQKLALFNVNPPVLVGASAWLTAAAAKSALVTNTAAKAVHIPNPIDTDFYIAEDRLVARRTLQLNPDKKYLLFAAMNASDPRKGFGELVAALKLLALSAPAGVELLVAGKADGALVAALPFPVQLLGSLNAAQMKQAYSAADVFIIPSLEENLPNTVLESLACGTVVAGFETGGIPEMVQEGVSGHLAPTGDVQGLATAIEKALLLAKTWKRPHDLLLNYQLSSVAARYIGLFKALLKS